MDDACIVAQISDTHVRADDSGRAAAGLRKALSQAGDYRVEAILLTGDLANDGREEEYALLAEVLTEASAPYFVVPGNHDDRARLRRAFADASYLPAAGPLSYAIDDFALRLVCLDQVLQGQTAGAFTAEMADWLDSTLAQAPRKPTLLALHHPPFLTHDLLFDRIGLKHSDLFADIVARHPQVVRVVCGHHHRAVVGQAAHAPVLASPSSAWTYGTALHAHQPLAPVTPEAPGWALHVWKKSGGCASHVISLT